MSTRTGISRSQVRDSSNHNKMTSGGLEKAFDRVPRRVIEWASRRCGVLEALVKAVMKMYKGAMTKVRCGNTFSESFPGEVGVHQGSVLSLLFFAIMIYAVWEDCKKEGLWNMLYVDDLVLTGEMMEQLEELFVRWRRAFEGKGLKVNVGKTKVMQKQVMGRVLQSK